MPARSRSCILIMPQAESAARSFWFADDLPGTSDETGSTGSDESDLLSARLVSSDGGRMTNMLMVTTTMRMLDGVHGNTSNSRPMGSLSLHLEVHGVGLKERLIGSLTTSGNANHGSAVTHDLLSVSRWQLNTSLSTVIDVTDDGG